MAHPSLFPGSGLELQDPALVGASSFVDGEFCRCSSKGDVIVINPANGRVVRRALAIAPSDLDRAVTSADRAFHKHWRDTAPTDRAQLLSDWAKLIREARDDIANIITLENGKPLNEARGEVDYGLKFIDWYAAEALRSHGSSAYDVSSNVMAVVSREPVGVVLCVTPWNFPIAMITRKVAGALAAGCSCIAKPSEQTPLTCLGFVGFIQISKALAELGRRAGIPPGVFNVVICKQDQSRHVVESILRSGPVRMVTFTGSTRVGSAISKVAAEGMLHTAMELGGNAPFVIFDDADIEASVNDMMSSKFRCAGQVCIACDRVYVQEKVYDTVVQLLIPKIAELGYHVGDGLFPGIKIGPLINDSAVQHAVILVQDAVEQGARVEVGGFRMGVPDSAQLRDAGSYSGRAVPLGEEIEMDEGGTANGVRSLRQQYAVKRANGNEYGDSEDRAQVTLNCKDEMLLGKENPNVHTMKTHGGKGQCQGFFFAPTLLTNVKDSMMVHDCEIFGPILALYRFSSEDELIARIRGQGRDSGDAKKNNVLSYSGLAAYIYTRDLGRAHRVSRNIPAGMVGINCTTISDPRTAFGGVGASGHGREGGPGLDEFTHCKYRVIKAPAPN